jgi:homoserine O-succinyltransferase/O-acetyltransferase
LGFSHNRFDHDLHAPVETVINNWIGKVYQVTNNDRKKPFQQGIDPNDPLGLKK